MNFSKKMTTAARSFVLALVVGLLASLNAWGQDAGADANSLETISVAGQQGGNIVVKMTFRQPLANPPAGFTINNPPRIAFDFPNTGNALGRNSQEVGDGDLRNMNIVQAGGRTRVVMNLTKAVGYETKLDGKVVLITLQTSTGDASAPATTAHFSEPKPGESRHSRG